MNDPMRNTTFAATIAKGIVRDRNARRTVLFFIVLGDILMVAAGAMPLAGWLGENPLLFLLYWGACIWLTLFSLLMAMYDLLMLRVERRRERQRLKAEVLGMIDDGDSKSEP